MRRNFIITSVVIVVLSLTGLGANYLLSLRKVSFTLDPSVSEIKVYSSSEKEVGNLSAPGTIRIRSGEYYITPAGDNIATDNIPFTVEDTDKEITIRPPYTKTYLGRLLQTERSGIEATILAKYPSLYPDYNLTNHTLYERGEWFGGLLTTKNSSFRDQKDSYRIVLHKKDDKWEVVRRPEYSLSSSRYKEVPIEVLRQINQLVP